MTILDQAILTDLSVQIRNGGGAEVYLATIKLMAKYAKFDLENEPVDAMPLIAEAFARQYEKEFPPERFR